MAFTPGKSCVICGKNIIGTGLKCDRCGQKVHKACWNRASGDDTSNEKLYCRAGRDTALDSRSPTPGAVSNGSGGSGGNASRFGPVSVADYSILPSNEFGLIHRPSNPSPPPTLHPPASGSGTGGSRTIDAGVGVGVGVGGPGFTQGAERPANANAPHLRYLPAHPADGRREQFVVGESGDISLSRETVNSYTSSSNSLPRSFANDDQPSPYYENVNPYAQQQPVAAPFGSGVGATTASLQSLTGSAYYSTFSQTQHTLAGAPPGPETGRGAGAGATATTGPAVGGRTWAASERERSSPSPSPSSTASSPSPGPGQGPSVSPTSSAASTLRRSKPVPKNARDGISTLKRNQLQARALLVVLAQLFHIS